MSRRLLSYDPLTGESVYFDYVEEGGKEQMILTHSYEADRGLDYAQSLANDEERTKQGIKEDMWHYAHITPAVRLDMLVKHGVDIDNPDHRAKMFQLLNTEYKKCKTTHLMHTIKNG